MSISVEPPITPTGLSATIGLPVSSSFCENWRYCPRSIVYVMGTPAGDPATPPVTMGPPPSASSVCGRIADVGEIVTWV